MSWASSPKGGKKKKGIGSDGATVARVAAPSGSGRPQVQLQHQLREPAPAPFASGGISSPFSSNNSRADSRHSTRSLDMDPEAVSHVWIPDRQDVWRLARLVRLRKDNASVSIPGICEEAFDVPRVHTRAWDPSHSLYLEDAAKLNNLHEAALLSLLHTRFANDDIYTYTGDVLISVNPYKTIPLLYSMPHDNSDAINRRITEGVGRLSDVEQMCHDPSEDSDCDDGSAIVEDGEGSVGAGGSNGLLKKSSLRKGHAGARGSDGVRFSDNGTGGNGRGGGSRRQSNASTKSDSVLDHPHVYAVADKAHRFMTDPSTGRLSGSLAGRRKRDQSIIITGESGAGKTEAAKYVMKYLIAASKAVATGGDATSNKRGRKRAIRASLAADEDDSVGDMERCLLESTVVLETFGNAKTVRNDNSSRFGKYIKLQYGANLKLGGARTLPFLLEKSRLVHQERHERNYHVFYQLCQGVTDGMRESLRVGDAPQYEMLRKGGVFMQSDEVDDAEEFRGLCSALSLLGVSGAHQEGLWRLLSALLHLGNIRFWEADGASGDGTPGLRLESPLVEVEDIATMTGLPADRLVSSMRKKVAMTGRGSFLEIPLDPTQASDNRNGLVKHIYGQIFNWLVGKINEAHGAGGAVETVAFVGILDIFGFEIMVRNSFEQLCINFANEVLQQQFNSHVFVLEQQEYEKEGLDWTMIEFKDNQPVIDLVSKKPRGLLVQLEEQGLLGRRANNKALLQLYHNTHLGKSACYSKPRFDSTEFIVLHFAGEVVYDIEGFLEKNNDSLHDNLLDLLDATVDPFLRDVMAFVDPEAGMEAAALENASFGNPLSPAVSPVRSPGLATSPFVKHHGGDGQAATSPVSPASSRTPTSSLPSRGNLNTFSFRDHRSGGGGSPNTFSSAGGSCSPARGLSPSSPFRSGRQDGRKGRIGGAGGPSQMSSTLTVSKAFRGQLQNLMATLRATEPHYIKCIKPNNVKAPGGFSSHLVHQQLNYSGVLEVVRIRREAYPGRIPFLEFFERFELLQRQLVQASTAGKETLALPPPAYATEAEAKQGCRSILEAFLPSKFFQIGHTRVFLKEEGQDMLRGALRGVYHRKAALIQACVRAMQGSMKLREKKAAAIVIHAAARMYLLRRRFQGVLSKVLLLQRWYRSRSIRHKYKGCIASAIMIQKRVRGMQAREYRLLQEVAAIIIQRHVRGMAGRRRAGLLLMDLWMEEEENRRREEEFQARRAAAILRSWIRRIIAKFGLKAQRVAAGRIQRAWLRRARNRWLAERVGRVFAIARAGDVDGMTRELRNDPDVLFMRDRNDRFKTLLHLAAMSGSTSLVSLLDPLPDDVLALDADGCTPLHHAAASCKYDVVKFLASRANGRVHAPARIKTDSVDAFMQETRATKRISMRIIQEARQRTGRIVVKTGSVIGTVAGGAATLRSLASRTNDDVIPAMTSSKPVFQGFLLKRRETGNWQKRWCVLTERDMEYYHSRQDHIKGKRPAKAVALATALLKRSGPPPALPPRPGDESGAISVGSLGLGPTSISGGFGSNGSSGTGGFGSNGGGAAVRIGVGGPAGGHGKGKGSKASAAVPDLAHCFELHSGKLLGDKRNREGRLYFKAASEEELYAWLVPLRVLVGSHNLVRTGAAGSLCYVDVARRKELVNWRNRAGETPLHYSAKGPGRAERDAIGRVQIATWLIENGSDPNAADSGGTTPLHAAVKRGHVPLAAALARRGGDLTLHDRHGRSPLDMINREQDVQDIAVGHFKAAERLPLLAPPVKLSSLTYLSFHLERLDMHNTADLHAPFITVSVHNSRGGKVETSQDASAPVVRRPNYLWWSASYHMQNPVENLEPGTRLVFTVKDQSTEVVQVGRKAVAGGGGVRELGWGMIHVNKSTMNSQEVSMEMYRPPMDLSKRALVPAEQFLSGYVTLTTAQEDMDAAARRAA